MSTPVEKMRNQEGGIITVANSCASIKSVNTVSILVVDDDTTCLSIVAAILKKFQYEVLTVKHARDALCALRIKGGAFDLVVTDVHMPDMNGFELQQAIAREFDLPVVLMSADDQEAVVLKGLDGGAAFFIAKPVSPDDLRDLWQFASMKKKSRVVIEETGSFTEEKSSDKINKFDEIVASASSSVNEGKNMNKKDSKRKSPIKEGSHEKKRENGQSSSLKKPKVVWTNALHNRFLEAIRSIGLERAVPKKILEVMNVPGLTRENVASHLQKYRIFLRRVTDASFKLHCSTLEKGLKPRFTSSYSLFDRINKLQNQFPGVNISASFLNQGASSSTTIPQSGFGQSRFLSNTGRTFQRSNLGHTNLVNQSNRALRLAQNNYQANTTSIQGHLSNMSLENLSRSYNTPINLGSTGLNLISSGTYGANSSNMNTGMISSDLINSPVPTENFKFKTTNYVGYNMANLRQLLESGKNCKNNDGFKSSDGAINVPSDQEFQNNYNANSAINLDQLVQHLEGSSPSTPFHNAGGNELSDVIADYQKLLPSNQGNVESVGEINQDCYSPMFDLADFGIIPSPPPLEESDLNSSFPNEVNIPNQVEQNGGDQNVSNSGFYGSTSHWDNSVPCFEQTPNQQNGDDIYCSSQEFDTPSVFTAPVPDNTELQGQKSLTNAMEFGTSSEFNKTLISPNEIDDYDFLESFLAPSPYGEDQTLGGI